MAMRTERGRTQPKPLRSANGKANNGIQRSGVLKAIFAITRRSTHLVDPVSHAIHLADWQYLGPR